MYKPAISMSFTFCTSREMISHVCNVFLTTISCWDSSIRKLAYGNVAVECIPVFSIILHPYVTCSSFCSLYLCGYFVVFLISFMYAIINHVVCDTSLRQCIIAFVIRPICARSWSVTIMFSNHHPWIVSVPWDRIIIILLCWCISYTDDVWSRFFASWRYYHAVLSYSYDIIHLCFRVFVIDVSLTTHRV